MKNITPIQWIIFGLLSIMTIVLPFLVSSSLLFPFITGKNFFFRVIVEVCLGLWIIDCLRSKEVRPKRSILALSIIGFVAIIGLADLLGVDSYRSFWSNYERMEGWITLVHLLAFFFVLASSLTEKLWYRLIQISLGTSFIIGVHALKELSEITRVDGNFGNSTYLGAYAMIHAFFSLMFLLRHLYEQNKDESFGIKVGSYSVLALFNFVVLYFTGTRSALLGLIGGLVVVAIIYIFTERHHKTLRNISIGIVGLVIIAFLSLSSIKNTEFAKSNPLIGRFSSLATLDIRHYAETEGKARFMVWGMALEGVKERPLLGWGQENFPHVFSKYYNPGMFEQEQWFDRTHNVFFDWLIAGGVLGLLAYLLMFVAALVLTWSRVSSISSVEKGIITGIIVAYFIHNLFVFDNLTSWILIFLVLSFVHIKNSKEINALSGILSDTSYYVISSIVGVVVIYGAFALNYAPYMASADIIKGISYGRGAFESSVSVQDKELYLEKSYEYFKSSIDRNTFGSRESGEQLSSTATQVARGEFGAAIKSKFTELSTKRLEDEAMREPLEARANLFHGSHLLSIGKNEEGLIFLQKAHELSPTKQTILFPLANAYSILGNKASSTEAFKKAYELDKSFAEPTIYYAGALIDSGKVKEASVLIDSVPEEKLLNTKHISFLIKIKRFDLIVKIFEQMVRNEPGNNQLKISLAAAYLENGDRVNAIKTIEEVASVMPEFKKQADYLISEIKAGRNPIDK